MIVLAVDPGFTKQNPTVCCWLDGEEFITHFIVAPGPASAALAERIEAIRDGINQCGVCADQIDHCFIELPASGQARVAVMKGGAEALTKLTALAGAMLGVWDVDSFEFVYASTWMSQLVGGKIIRANRNERKRLIKQYCDLRFGKPDLTLTQFDALGLACWGQNQIKMDKIREEADG